MRVKDRKRVCFKNRFIQSTHLSDIARLTDLYSQKDVIHFARSGLFVSVCLRKNLNYALAIFVLLFMPEPMKTVYLQ